MKRTKLFVWVLAAALLLCACTGRPNQNLPHSRSDLTKWVVSERQVEIPSQTVEHGEDYVIQWEDPAMEAHIRFVLNQPEGDILHSDVWEIQALRISANGVDAAWTEPTEGAVFNTADSAKNASYLAEGGNLENLTSLNDLRHFDSLQVFYYTAKVPYDSLTDLSGLEACTGLKVLSLYGAKPVTLAPLAALTKLESLTLSNCGALDLSPLEGLQELEVLGLSSSNELASLEPLTTLPKLRYLSIGIGTTYPSLDPLTRTHIEFLDMGLGVGDEKTCKGLDYEPLTRMPDLKYLDLMNHLDLTADLCKRIAAGSPNLRGLDISYTPAADHSKELQALGIEWLQDPTNRSINEFWRRLIYKLT